MKLFAEILFLCLAAACGGRPPAPVSVSIVPESVVIPPGGVQHFAATVAGASDGSVVWSVSEGPSGGTISSDGVYQAPAAATETHVVATSKADPSQSAIAQVTVAGADISISIAPDHRTIEAGFPYLDFQATVIGASDTGVLWSVEEGARGGAIDASGRYTPPETPGVFHVVATSHANRARFAVATITIIPNPRDMIDHGGQVFSTTRTFLLFWGDAEAFPADARGGLERLLGGLEGSSYLSVVDQYLRGASAHTAWAGTFFDSSAPPPDGDGTILGEGACRALATNGIAAQPGDFVLVSTSNCPTNMSACAWHGWTTCNGQIVVYAYAPNPAGSRCGTSTDFCSTGYSSAALGLVVMTSHELMESITDPFGTAWSSSGGFEMMDGCGEITCVSLSTGIVPVPTAYSNAAHTCVNH